jgi:hypothetical protein
LVNPYLHCRVAFSLIPELVVPHSS